MEITYSALFYSKYSNSSNKFLQMLTDSRIDFSKTIGLVTVCIDNEKIRKRILNSKNIKIEHVPCILNLYNDGGVEKYEGNDAFKWLEEIISKVNQPQQQQQQLQQKPEQQVKQEQPVIQKNIPSKKVTTISDLDENFGDESDEIKQTMIDDDDDH